MREIRVRSAVAIAGLHDVTPAYFTMVGVCLGTTSVKVARLFVECEEGAIGAWLGRGRDV